MCCNPAKGRVDIEELLAYIIQLQGGNEWIESLSANWYQCPIKKDIISQLFILKQDQLEKSVIHGDLNEQNLLVRPKKESDGFEIFRFIF